MLIVYVPLSELLSGVLQHATEDRSLIVGLAFIITPVLELLKSLARRCWFAKLS